MNLIIKKASTPAHFTLLDELAHTIWREHYLPIIGNAQVEYMLGKFQSEKVMLEQVDEGYEYYLVWLGNEAVGYLSFKQEEESLFLSKIYLLAGQRGKGLGREMMNFVEGQGRDRNISSIRLTVNKFNKATIESYLKMGFERIRDIVIDIGNGFVMDDYEMVKKL